MSDNPYVKKAVLGTRDYHETMRGIVRTIVNDSLHTQMEHRADKMENVHVFEIKPFPSPIKGRYTVATNWCYPCVLKIRQIRRKLLVFQNVILLPRIVKPLDDKDYVCPLCGNVIQTERHFKQTLSP